MIIWTKKEGYIYEHETSGNRYHLYEMTCLNGEATSDMFAIWDHANDENVFVNWCAGATILSMEEINEAVADYVEEYEVKKQTTTKTETEVEYRLTKAGVKAWECDVVDDILDKDICEPYIISHGNRSIKLPDLAEIHDALSAFLEEAEEIANEW
jgi:hypothetical protein